MRSLLCFVAGLAIGATGTYLYLKEKTEKEIENEVEKFKKDYQEKFKANEIAKQEAKKAKEKGSILNYTKMYSSKEVDIKDYIPKHMNIDKALQELPKDDNRLITQIDFAMDDDYEKIGYTLFSDGLIADEIGELIEDIDDRIDKDIIYRFLVSEEDELYYRDDDNKIDYEILKSARTFNERDYD